MALLDWMAPDPSMSVTGARVRLRSPRLGDYAAWASLREQSRAHLVPWEPSWPEDDLSRPAFKRRLSIYAREMELGHAWPFFILRLADDALVGAVTLSNVRRGVAETGTLGYWVGLPFIGAGLATDAVQAMCSFAFSALSLHRVEAACLPENHASRRVLEKSGFEHEGRARAYLKINGQWRDHLLFGRVADPAGAED